MMPWHVKDTSRQDQQLKALVISPVPQRGAELMPCLNNRSLIWVQAWTVAMAHFQVAAVSSRDFGSESNTSNNAI
jgi:hypothetical protein